MPGNTGLNTSRVRFSGRTTVRGRRDVHDAIMEYYYNEQEVAGPGPAIGTRESSPGKNDSRI